MVHEIAKPNWAPAWLYVPIPLGSSSDAPVMSPGPIRRSRLSLFALDARAGRSSFVVSAMTSSPRDCAGGAWASTPPAIRRQPYNPLTEPKFPHGVGGTQLLRRERMQATSGLARRTTLVQFVVLKREDKWVVKSKELERVFSAQHKAVEAAIKLANDSGKDGKPAVVLFQKTKSNFQKIWTYGESAYP